MGGAQSARVDGLGVKRKRTPVAGLFRRAALDQAAVEQQLPAADRYPQARTRNLTRGAVKRDVQSASSDSVRLRQQLPDQALGLGRITAAKEIEVVEDM